MATRGKNIQLFLMDGEASESDFARPLGLSIGLRSCFQARSEVSFSKCRKDILPQFPGHVLPYL